MIRNLKQQKNMSQPEYRIIISGGGTGGHIFPAIAIADGLKKRLGHVDILFIGAKGRMEMEKVPQAGYPVRGLWISGIQRKLSWKNLSFPFKLISSMIGARQIVKKFRPHVAIGTGGYASGPMLRVASRMGIPSLIQEQNSFPGITNRILAKTVDRICVAFEGMEKYFPESRIVITGNPVRAQIIDMQGSRDEGLGFFGLEPGLKTMLVIGGSQGARSVNLAVEKHLAEILGEDRQLIWQCGKAFLPQAREKAGSMEPGLAGRVVTVDFIARMDLAYAAADMVLSRAGAIAISELCIAGKPLILVPLPGAAEDHQTRNAMALQEKGAAIIINDHELDKKLCEQVSGLLLDDEKRRQMSENIKKMAKPGATERIVDEVIKLLER